MQKAVITYEVITAFYVGTERIYFKRSSGLCQDTAPVIGGVSSPAAAGLATPSAGDETPAGDCAEPLELPTIGIVPVMPERFFSSSKRLRESFRIRSEREVASAVGEISSSNDGIFGIAPVAAETAERAERAERLLRVGKFAKAADWAEMRGGANEELADAAEAAEPLLATGTTGVAPVYADRALKADDDDFAGAAGTVPAGGCTAGVGNVAGLVERASAVGMRVGALAARIDCQKASLPPSAGEVPAEVIPAGIGPSEPVGGLRTTGVAPVGLCTCGAGVCGAWACAWRTSEYTTGAACTPAFVSATESVASVESGDWALVADKELCDEIALRVDGALFVDTALRTDEALRTDGALCTESELGTETEPGTESVAVFSFARAEARRVAIASVTEGNTTVLSF